MKFYNIKIILFEIEKKKTSLSLLLILTLLFIYPNIMRIFGYIGYLFGNGIFWGIGGLFLVGVIASLPTAIYLLNNKNLKKDKSLYIFIVALMLVLPFSEVAIMTIELLLK